MSQRGSAGGDWRLTLQAGNATQAARQLFIGRLGWSTGEIACLRDISVVECVPDESCIGVAGSDHQLELTWMQGGRSTRIVLDRDHPTPMQIQFMERLAWEGAGDPLSIVQTAFDADRVGLDFALSAAEIAQKFSGDAGRRSGAERIRLFQIGIRLCFLKMLEAKRWASFGETGYLEGMWASHQDDPQSYSLFQRIALACESALVQPSQEARRLLRRLVGELPYTGPVLFPTLFSSVEMDEPATAFFGEFIALCGRFDFSFSEPGILHRDLAVSPYNVAQFAAAALDRPMPDEAVARRLGARRLLDADPASNAAFVAFDSPCGWGDHLAAVLAELSQGANPRLALAKQIRGLSEDTVEIAVTRLRLAGHCFARDVGGTPEPILNLDSAVCEGRVLLPDHMGELPTLSQFVPPEGATIAHRAWASRDGVDRLLRLVSAFMNAEGGIIYLGVDDTQMPMPLGDLTAEGALAELVARSNIVLQPPPGALLRGTIIQVGGHPVVRLDISPSTNAVYFASPDANGEMEESLFVRVAGRTRLLTGPAREKFVRERRR